ncbi:MAG: polysaccharide biosynthesis protein [Fibrobacteres bacterium]|nr:polysaccharide biosynthesis protein [Fibrobacterota bacterium]
MLYIVSKRAFDLFCSIVGLIVFSPIILIVAIAVKLTSKGPVFFRQDRVGLNGHIFRIFKFRTMTVAAANGPKVTAKNDARITTVGKILRQTKLDEIPQLLNVFWGTMSFVGPRPEIPALVETYTTEQKALLTVKPGITSPATIYHRDEEDVSGTAEEVMDYHRKVLVPRKAQYDLGYLEKKSISYDIKLILLTLLAVVSNESGYVREKAVKNRRALIIAAVAVLLCVAYYVAFLIRFEGYIPDYYDWKLKRTLPLIVAIQFIFLGVFGQLEGYWRYVSISDIISVAKALVLSAIAMLGFEYFFLAGSYPTGVVFINGFLAFILLSGQRLSLRLLREAYAPITPKSREKVIILGAGDRAERVYREIKQNPDLAFSVVGFIDQSSKMKGVKIHGIQILGAFEDLPELVEKHGVSTLIDTLENLTKEQTAVLTRLRASFKCSIRNVPSASDYITGKVTTSRLREIAIEELLGRQSVNLDIKNIESLFRGKTVLITGAGGSIGSELVRQLVRFEPAKLLLLDKDETLLYELETDLVESHPVLMPYEVIISDIRNKETLAEFFKKYKPEVVLHAAAYKHVPLMELHPHEAVQNNVFGTRNVLAAASEAGVSRFVMISTDKAVRSTNVMGATKRLAESIMYRCYAKKGMKCMAVRFGNVLGSRGSVIPLFQRQIRRGGPVRITHPDITRFFMSIPEAAQLVLQAAAMGNGGELFILKMGEPVLIRELAERLIEFHGFQPGVDIDIEYTGLRPGEKLYEELLTDLEGTRTTPHDKILVIDNSAEEDTALLNKISEVEERGIFKLSITEVKDLLHSLVSDYKPQN